MSPARAGGPLPPPRGGAASAADPLAARRSHRRGGRLDNIRRREWAPAIETGAIRTSARIYDLRSTFASNAIAAGIDVFELARVMGTSIEMIERHYGTPLSGAAAGIASRLAAFEADQDPATDEAFEDV